MVAISSASMRAILATIAVLPLGSGCFYTDPINERPSADIERETLDNPMRGSTIRLRANIFEPDGNDTVATFSAVACDELECDEGEIEAIRSDFTITFDVPLNTQRGTPTSQVAVTLDVTDDLGANAVPRQQLDIPVGNEAPTLEVQKQGRTFMGRYPVDVPMTIVARKDDFDDGAAAVTIDEPVLYAPAGATIEDATLMLVDETDTELTWELTASMPGQWEVELTARDPFTPDPGEVTVTVTIPVAEDQSPCLTVGEPGFPPEGATIVLEDARRFAVLAVDDDLDLWPAPDAQDPHLGVITFRWYLATPDTGGVLTALTGVDGSGVDLDPASYTPGDELTLRVEVSDRVNRPLCDPALDTCAATPGCFQRQTWHVEVR